MFSILMLAASIFAAPPLPLWRGAKANPLDVTHHFSSFRTPNNQPIVRHVIGAPQKRTAPVQLFPGIPNQPIRNQGPGSVVKRRRPSGQVFSNSGTPNQPIRNLGPGKVVKKARPSGQALSNTGTPSQRIIPQRLFNSQ